MVLLFEGRENFKFPIFFSKFFKCFIAGSDFDISLESFFGLG